MAEKKVDGWLDRAVQKIEVADEALRYRNRAIADVVLFIGFAMAGFASMGFGPEARYATAIAMPAWVLSMAIYNYNYYAYEAVIKKRKENASSNLRLIVGSALKGLVESGEFTNQQGRKVHGWLSDLKEQCDETGVSLGEAYESVRRVLQTGQIDFNSTEDLMTDKWWDNVRSESDGDDLDLLIGVVEGVNRVVGETEVWSGLGVGDVIGDMIVNPGWVEGFSDVEQAVSVRLVLASSEVGNSGQTPSGEDSLQKHQR